MPLDLVDERRPVLDRQTDPRKPYRIVVRWKGAGHYLTISS